MNWNTIKFEYGSWENAWFMQGNHVYQFSGTTKGTQLQDDDYSKTINGTSSNYMSTSYNTMASFPLCWIHRSQKPDGTRVVKIANMQVDATYHAYGWESDNGYVQDEMFIGVYEGYNYSNRIVSVANQTPSNTLTYQNDLTYCQANGTGFNPIDYCKWSALQDLLILVSKSTNCEASFGNGYISGSAVKKTNADSTIMIGRFNGDQVMYTTPVKTFHLENLWGNVNPRLAGISIDTAGVPTLQTHGPYSTSVSNGVTLSHVRLAYTLDFIKSGIETAYGFFATTAGGSATTYECDAVYGTGSALSNTSYIVGGQSTEGDKAGIFAYNPKFTITSAAGSRLAYTPQETTGTQTADIKVTLSNTLKSNYIQLRKNSTSGEVIGAYPMYDTNTTYYTFTVTEPGTYCLTGSYAANGTPTLTGSTTTTVSSLGQAYTVSFSAGNQSPD